MKEGKKMRNAYVSATTPNDDDDDIIEALSKYAFNSQILLVSYIIEHPILLVFYFTHLNDDFLININMN
jgi:hypothetical protein